MAYSQTYNFPGYTQVSDFVTQAFERCGILGPDISGLQVTSAISSLNFILSEWANEGFKLFTIEKAMFQMFVGQPSYVLPQGTVETPEVTVGNINGVYGGTAFSSAGGNAQNAFNQVPGQACTQVAPNGYISYTYPAGLTPAIYYVGVQSNVTITYDLVFEYSLDGVTWVTSLIIGPQLFLLGSLQWFVPLAPINAMAVRIREIGGAILNVQQIYFSVPSYAASATSSSRILTSISREEWTSYPDKSEIAVPASFYLDRQDTPIMTLWPTPDDTYSTVIYNRSVQIMDVTAMNQNINVPQRFMKAVRDSLSAELALKFAPEKADRLLSLADMSLLKASREDVEKVPMRIYPNISSYT